VVECCVQLVDRLGTKGVTNFGSIERDANGSDIDRPVVRDVGEVETGDRFPCCRVEDIRYHGSSVDGALGDTVVTMEHDTPHGWLSRGAERDPEAPALVVRDGVVSYADLDRQVTLRAGSLAREVRTGEIVAVPVHLDLASVTEVLALMRTGAVVAPYASERPTIASAAPEGTALCIATSGSTSAPRFVPLSYGNLSASVAASRSRLGNGPHDRWLATLPFQHIGGISVLLRSLEAGGAIVLAPFGRDTASVIDTAAPTIASLVPTMVHRLLEHDPDSLASIGIVLTGGARLTVRMRRIAAARGASLLPTYGMTEAASQIATAVPGTPPSEGNMVGPLLDGFSVSILTPEGLAEPGEAGVIEVDGPAVFSGYLDAPPRTGPHRTSDLGFLGADGSVGVIGRIDDVVMTGGENVSLSLVARTIEDLAGVREVAVVGIADHEWGTAICALIELEPEARPSIVMDAIAAALDDHAVPKRTEVGAVPLLGNGKHDLVAVRSHFDSR
jgi:acyl-CoA synthetase (AMP-forming)/AMP-acid ligase II